MLVFGEGEEAKEVFFFVRAEGVGGAVFFLGGAFVGARAPVGRKANNGTTGMFVERIEGGPHNCDVGVQGLIEMGSGVRRQGGRVTEVPLLEDGVEAELCQHKKWGQIGGRWGHGQGWRWWSGDHHWVGACWGGGGGGILRWHGRGCQCG